MKYFVQLSGRIKYNFMIEADNDEEALDKAREMRSNKCEENKDFGEDFDYEEDFVNEEKE